MAVIRVRVKPGSRASGLEVQPDGSYLVRLKSPPVDGRANAELIDLVARHFRCAKASVSIKTGTSSRVKLVKIESA